MAKRETAAVRWSVRTLSLVFSVGAGLAIAELGFRLFWIRRLTLEAGIEDPHFHHRLKPNETYRYTSQEFDVSVRTNRFGLRGPDPILPKPAGITRILMLGDSFTFGFPVRDEETFCSLIETDLKSRGYPVDVVNGGLSGYSPTLHYISLRDQYLSFEPDMVILWYDLGDLQEDYWFQKNLIRDEKGRIVRCDPWYVNGRFDSWEWLKNRTALTKYIDTKLLKTIGKIRTLGPSGYLRAKLSGERAKVAIARLKSWQHADDLAAHDRFLLVRESSTETSIESYWDLSAKYLTMIRDLLAQRGIPLAVGIYPYGMVVGPDQWAEGRAYWGFERGRTYDAGLALRLFERFSVETGIPLINTYGSFRQAAQKKLFYDWDGHMTPEGHRVLASHLAEDPRFLAQLDEQLNRANQSLARSRKDP